MRNGEKRRERAWHVGEVRGRDSICSCKKLLSGLGHGLGHGGGVSTLCHVHNLGLGTGPFSRTSFP